MGKKRQKLQLHVEFLEKTSYLRAIWLFSSVQAYSKIKRKVSMRKLAAKHLIDVFKSFDASNP